MRVNIFSRKPSPQKHVIFWAFSDVKNQPAVFDRIFTHKKSTRKFTQKFTPDFGESTQNIHAESTRKIFTQNATCLLVVAHQKCFPTRCIKLSLQMIATDAFILARVEYDEYANPKHVKTDICDCVSLRYLDVSFGAAAKIFTQNPLWEMLFMIHTHSRPYQYILQQTNTNHDTRHTNTTRI